MRHLLLHIYYPKTIVFSL